MSSVSTPQIARIKAKYRIGEYIGKYANKKQVRKEIIKLLGVTEVSLSLWENISVGQDRTITPANLTKLAKYFNVSISEMTN